MATEIADAYIALYTKMPGVKGDIERNLGKADAEGAGKSVGSKFSAGIAGVVGGAMAAVTSKAISSIAGSIDSAIARVDTINNFPKIMQNLGYSSDEAAASIETMSTKLTGLPTALDSMAGMVQQLAPLTGGLSEATDLSLALNNALIAGGKSTDQQANAMEQYTQMLAVGNVDMAAWRSMVSAMPGQMDQLSESILGAGSKSMDLYQAMKDGTVGFDEFNDAVLRLNDEGTGAFASFSQQALDATGGIATSQANLQTAIVRGLADVIDKAQPAISGLISMGTDLANTLFPIIASAVEWIVQAFENVDPAVFSDLLASLSPVGAAFQVLEPLIPVIADAFVQIGTALGGAMQGAIAAIVPILVDLATVLADSLAVVLPVVMLVIEELAGVFGELLAAILPVVAELITALMPVFEAIAPIIEALLPIFSGIIAALMPIIEAILPILVDLFEMLAPVVLALVEAFMPLLEPILALIEPLMGLVAAILPPLVDLFGFLISTILPPLTMAIDALVPVISGVVSAISGFLIPVIETISTVLNGVTSFLNNVFKGNWEGAWNSIVDIFTGLWEGMKSIATGVLNGIIDVINGVIGGINGLASSVSDITGGAINLSIPSIPRLAEGGIVRARPGGILANIGEGRYDEAVIPLSPAVLSQLGGGGHEIKQFITVPETSNPVIFGRKMGRGLKEELVGVI